MPMNGAFRIAVGELNVSKTKGAAFKKELQAKLSPKGLLSKTGKEKVCKA